RADRLYDHRVQRHGRSQLGHGPVGAQDPGRGAPARHRRGRDRRSDRTGARGAGDRQETRERIPRHVSLGIPERARRRHRDRHRRPHERLAWVEPHPAFLWRTPEPKSSYEVVIVGGGGHGLATAYYLAKNHGITDVAVLERGWLAGGNITRNTTVIRSSYLWDESAAIYEHSLKLWEGLEAELEYDLLFSQRGVLNLAHSLQDVRDGRRRVKANRLSGIDGEWLDPAGVAELCPLVDVSPGVRYPVLGATYQPRAGIARHENVAWGFARAADALGVDLL